MLAGADGRLARRVPVAPAKWSMLPVARVLLESLLIAQVAAVRRELPAEIRLELGHDCCERTFLVVAHRLETLPPADAVARIRPVDVARDYPPPKPIYRADTWNHPAVRRLVIIPRPRLQSAPRNAQIH